MTRFLTKLLLVLVPKGLSMFTRTCAIVRLQRGSLIFLLFLHMKLHSQAIGLAFSHVTLLGYNIFLPF